MPIAEAIADFFRLHRLDPGRIVVAVSGGPDSTALLLALRESFPAIDLHSAHVEHRLRGDESDEDAAWIGSFAGRLGIEHHQLDGTLDPAELRRAGVESAARAARYLALEKLRVSIDASLVATAHNQNDEAETVLLRLVTGSGPHRLKGIEPIDELRHLVRPLLRVPRAEIEQFLAARGVVARHDRTNDSNRFVRNRIRNEILPMLASVNPSIIATLAETASQGREMSEAIEWMIREVTSRAVRRTESQSIISLEERPPAWLFRAILLREILRLQPDTREVGADDLRRLESGVESRVSVSSGVELLRKPHAWRLQLRSAESPAHAFLQTIEPGANVRIEQLGATIGIREAKDGDPIDRNSIQLPVRDAALTLRTRREGDRFQPLGSPFPRKLKDVLIDRKIERDRRNRLPLLLVEDSIAWVEGVGVSEQFKVADPARSWFRIVVKED